MSSVEESTAEDEVYHSAEEGDGLEDRLDRLEVKSKGDSSKGQPIGGGRGEEEEQIHTESNEKVTEGGEQDSKKVELTEEQRKELIEKGDGLKKRGNEHYKVEEYELAIECYSEALEVYPTDSWKEVSVAHGNLSACWMKLNEHDKVIEECTKALKLDERYIKALLRRAQSYEATEKLENAFEDYKKVLEIDPSSQVAREAVMRLPDQIKEQQEKMKAEMLGKLKELGDAILKPFGLSTNNFKFQQDPNTGGYSMNFQK